MYFSAFWRWFFSILFVANTTFVVLDVSLGTASAWTLLNVGVAVIMALSFFDNEMKPRRPY